MVTTTELTVPQHLAACTGLDDPVFRAASQLADAWGPALARAERIGFENGRIVGRAEAEREMAESWRAAVKPIRAVLAQPTQAEMAIIRGEVA